MTFDEIEVAVKEAENTLHLVELQKSAMVKMLRGRLRGVSPWMLAFLKRELKSFNASTFRWKS